MGTQLTLPQRAHLAPISGQCLLWPNVWMDQDATRYGGRHRSRRNCVRWGTQLPPQKKEGAQPSPNFRPMSIVACRAASTLIRPIFRTQSSDTLSLLGYSALAHLSHPFERILYLFYAHSRLILGFQEFLYRPILKTAFSFDQLKYLNFAH